MEIRVFLVYIIYNLLIPSTISKTFSLNEAIAAEERNNSRVKSALSGSLLNADRIQDSVLDYHKQNIRDISKALSTNFLSPLKYRRPFPFKSSLKPNKILRQAHKGHRIVDQRNQVKQQQNEEINENYIPLFKSLSIILDNIFKADSGEAIIPKHKYKRNKNIFESKDVVCKCAFRSTTESNLADSYQETAAAATFTSTEVETVSSAAVTTSKTHRIAHNNNSNRRRNQNLPILPARNTLSFGRNNSGIYERRGTAHIRNNEGFTIGNNRDHEHNPRVRNISSYKENSEENTYTYTQNISSSDESRVVRPESEPISSKHFVGKGDTVDKHIQASINFERNLPGHKEKDRVSNRSIQEESTTPLSKLTTRLQRIEPQKTETIQPKEKDYAAINRFITSAKQIFNRNSQNSSFNKRSSRGNETMELNRDNSHNKGIMIFDGYSVARDFNGENKLSEKAVEIRT